MVSLTGLDQREKILVVHASSLHNPPLKSVLRAVQKHNQSMASRELN